jgi:hypothetical protein
MPSVKRTGVKSAEVKTGFESYDGPEPTRRGMYRARIAILQFKTFRTGSQGFKIQVILEAAKGDPKGHKQFDGYPQFSNIVFGDKDAMITRENNFYAALGLKDEPVIVYEDKGDLEEGIDIKTLGGKSLAAIKKLYVNVDLKPRRDGQDGMEIDGIYKLKEVARSGAGTKAEEAEDEEDLLEDEGEEEEAEESDAEARAEELAEAGLPDLRSLAKEYGLKTVGLKKDAIIDAILEYEADLPEDEEEEEPDEEEEEPEEEEGDDERSARAEELADLDRAKLKLVLKKVNADFSVYKSTTDDDIREAILDAEFGAADETPF